MYLVKNKRDDCFYAMKRIKKIDIANKRRLTKTFTEKKVRIIKVKFALDHGNERESLFSKH